jgi:hypothetical protein
MLVVKSLVAQRYALLGVSSNLTAIPITSGTYLQRRDKKVTTKLPGATTRPRPYLVNPATAKVQTLELDGDQRKLLFDHNLSCLNSSNFQLLLEKEKATKRVTEKMTKNRLRRHEPSSKPDAELYKTLIVSGAFRPYGLTETYDEETTIPTRFRPFFEANGDGKFHVRPLPVERERMLGFSEERQKNALERYLECKGEVVSIARDETDISFMFDDGGIMAVRLLIGDPESPAYRLKLLFHRPESTRRTNFKDDFAYGVEYTKGGLGKIETIIDLRQGYSFFQEHFTGISTEPDEQADGTIIEYSEVVFRDTRSLETRLAAGQAPRPVSAVDDGEAGENAVAESEDTENQVEYVSYCDALRSQFLAEFNPMYGIEAAAAVVQSFGRTERD